MCCKIVNSEFTTSSYCYKKKFQHVVGRRYCEKQILILFFAKD